MTRPDPDQLADRLEKEITGGAFVLSGPEEVALCVAALRFYAPWESKQPAKSPPAEKCPSCAGSGIDLNRMLLSNPPKPCMCSECGGSGYGQAAEQPTLRTPDTARPVHPKLAAVLDSYGAAGRVAE